MSDREWAVWTFAPLVDAEPTITPAGNQHWAERRANAARSAHVRAEVVWRYDFMPGMPWELLDETAAQPFPVPLDSRRTL